LGLGSERSSRAYPHFPSRPERGASAEGKSGPRQQVRLARPLETIKKPEIQTEPEISVTLGAAIGAQTPGRSLGVASAAPRGVHTCPAYSQRRSNQSRE
jgi:hypothetical protein